MTNNNPPLRRRLNFVPGLEPGPTVIRSERSFDELCEAYISQQRDRAAVIQEAVQDGSGDQSAKPPLPDGEPDQARPRRRPGVR